MCVFQLDNPAQPQASFWVCNHLDPSPGSAVDSLMTWASAPPPPALALVLLGFLGFPVDYYGVSLCV